MMIGWTLMQLNKSENGKFMRTWRHCDDVNSSYNPGHTREDEVEGSTRVNYRREVLIDSRIANRNGSLSLRSHYGLKSHKFRGLSI